MPIRSLFPIEATFDIRADKDQLLENLLPSIKPLLDDTNVYKVAKVVSFAFELNHLENSILFEYFKKLVEENSNLVDHGAIKQFEEKVEVLV